MRPVARHLRVLAELNLWRRRPPKYTPMHKPPFEELETFVHETDSKNRK